MALGVGDILRTSANFLLHSGDQYQNVYHHIFDGIGGVSDEVVTLAIKAWAQTAYGMLAAHTKSTAVAQLSFVDRVEWVLDGWEVVENIGTFTPLFIPSHVGDDCPNTVSAFVVFKTARPKTVGRKFLFPAPETGQVGGIMEADYVAAVVAYTAEVMGDIDIDVANVLHPGVVRTAVNDFLTFTVGIVTNLLGSQRRRRQGYGA